ncbi:hypothetical protein ACPV47_24425 [Vibrio jasicida]|uniref:hypothetical protein n=1 Tax=Vibrio jasicida TaxID=766224 RepID=UPI0040694721
MFKMFPILVLGAVFISSNSSAAFYVNGDVTSGGVQWDNVVYGKGKMVPSKWGVPPALQSVVSWSAASIPSAPPSTMTLTGGSGETSSPIPVSITGMQYNSSGIDFTQSASGLGGGCLTDEVTLPIVSVDGIGCVSSTKLSTLTPSSPFIFFRPMFDINEMDVVSALSGLSEGIYSASIPISVRYYYENIYGVTTFRNINEVMIFTFDYQPVQLDDITVIGDGVMEPVYDVTQRRVSSDTTFNITATGYFNNGLVLTMPTQSYELENSLKPEVVIPYNIQCNQCSVTGLVSEGSLLEPVTTIAEAGGVQTNISFDLFFNYNVDGELIESGEYLDTVTFMLEPGI